MLKHSLLLALFITVSASASTVPSVPQWQHEFNYEKSITDTLAVQDRLAYEAVTRNVQNQERSWEIVSEIFENFGNIERLLVLTVEGLRLDLENTYLQETVSVRSNISIPLEAAYHSLSSHDLNSLKSGIRLYQSESNRRVSENGLSPVSQARYFGRLAPMERHIKTLESICMNRQSDNPYTQDEMILIRDRFYRIAGLVTYAMQDPLADATSVRTTGAPRTIKENGSDTAYEDLENYIPRSHPIQETN